jgi:pyruvate,water dikinase
VPEVATLLAERPPDLFSRLKGLPQAAEFVQRFEHLLLVYGDRTRPGHSAHITLEMLPWRETPEWVLDMVAKYVSLMDEPAHETPAAARRQARQQRDQAVEALCAAAPQPHLAGEFRRWLAYARRNAIFTDEHNHYIDHLASGQFFQALLYAGRWLAARGDLAQPGDVAWLRILEIVSALRSPDPQPLDTTLAARQQEHAGWRKLHAPAFLGLPSAVVPSRPSGMETGALEASSAVAERENVLIGQGVSPGRGSGRARLVPASALLPEVSAGDVLVAMDAGALWTPIFPILAGVVLEGGSAGQHAAITAREFGVPAVFGAGQATHRIPEGARVTLDGTQGTVEWTDASAAQERKK